jgi:phosphatidylinositol-3-phosphatase
MSVISYPRGPNSKAAAFRRRSGKAVKIGGMSLPPAGGAWKAWIGTLAPLFACLLLAGALFDWPRGSEATPPPPPPPAAGPTAGHFPHIGRVAVLVLENREYGAVIGRRQGHYLTRLARRYALAARYYALGHPSLPNYLGMTAGSTFDVSHDCNGCDFERPSLLNQLDNAGISWKAYFEGLPWPGYLGARLGGYSKHFDPFAYDTRLTSQPADRSRIVPLSQLFTDMRAHSLPRFIWIAPNLCHDSHYCSVATSDQFASRLVPRILRTLGPHGVLYLTWDEGTTRAGTHGHRGGGHVALIAAGPASRRGAIVRRLADHYSLLRTIEAGYRLPALGRAGAHSTPLLTGLLRR